MQSDLEAADQAVHRFDQRLDRTRGFCGSVHGDIGLFCQLGDGFDALGDFGAGAALLGDGQRDVVDRKNNFAGGCVEFFNGAACFVCAGAAVGYCGYAAVHPGNSLVNAVLNHADDAADLDGRLGGPFRQLAHLIGYHREATPLLSGTSGFDGGVERQQIGLIGNFFDDVGYLADFFRFFAEFFDSFRGAFDGFRN